MNANTAQSQTAEGNNAAFEFVKALAFELSSGKIDLPSFPDVAVRVRRALADDRTTVEQVTRIVGSEPALAARLLKMSNSAMLNRSGKQVTDLKAAIARMGYNMVRSAAISFAMAQIRASANLKAVEKPLKDLWQQSTYVAALSYVVAKKQTRINPDEAFLAGLLHGIGKLYILSRHERHPVLFADEEALAQVIRDWHANVGKAIMENWEMAESLVNAIGDQEDIEREHEGSADLTDVVICANMMAAYYEQAADLELNMQGVNAFGKLSLDAASTTAIIAECGEEIAALREALG